MMAIPMWEIDAAQSAIEGIPAALKRIHAWKL